MDGLTSSLDEQEVEKLFGLMRNLREKGVGIIFVIHFLDQVYEVCDRIAVMRDGQLVGEYAIKDLPRVQLVSKTGRWTPSLPPSSAVPCSPAVWEISAVRFSACSLWAPSRISYPSIPAGWAVISVRKGAQKESPMLKTKKYQFWFCTGSQDLYGEECLAHVAEHSGKMVEALNASGNLPYEVVWKPTLVTDGLIRKTFNEANIDEACAGVITWMHTFSPARSWIHGLQDLCKFHG